MFRNLPLKLKEKDNQNLTIILFQNPRKNSLFPHYYVEYCYKSNHTNYGCLQIYYYRYFWEPWRGEKYIVQKNRGLSLWQEANME